MTVSVKICGLINTRGLAAAVEAGASFVGLNFFRHSPRYVTLEQAAELSAEVPRRIKVVGLFVCPTDSDLQAVLNVARLDMIQLHGKETPARVDEVRKITGLPVMKGLGIATARDVVEAQLFDGHADWLLFDAKPPADAMRPGGNAVSFDWTLLKTYSGKTPWMLAGGLTRANVTAAIKASGARAVDVSSGVETRPGIKSPAHIRAFIKAVAAASVGHTKS
jgi:phosphoribosylanthranilate isomerase